MVQTKVPCEKAVYNYENLAHTSKYFFLTYTIYLPPLNKSRNCAIKELRNKRF
jgi:hypothetical protein